MRQESGTTEEGEGSREMGFSLVELLVVMSVAAVLGATLLSAAGQTRVRAGRGQCLINSRQLINGYRMYALDNEDHALGAWSSPGVPAWLGGGYSDFYGVGVITNSPTYPYIQSVGAFRCPDDESSVLNPMIRQVVLRNRSYSVNGLMGPPSFYAYPSYKPVIKLSDVDMSGPSSIYVLIEEHANSLNDSHFLPFRDLRAFSGQRWLDAPTGRHHNSASISFADGHVKMHEWKDSDLTPEVLSPIVRYGIQHLAAPGPGDFEWFTEHVAPRE